MKSIRHIIIAMFAMVAFLTLAGCNQTSHNGHLDGQWQILTIEEKSTGSVTVTDHGACICIYLDVLQLTDKKARLTANMDYDKKANTLSCDFPYVKPADVEASLGRFGFYTNPIKFDIIKLTGKELVLSSDETVITCRKF